MSWKSIEMQVAIPRSQDAGKLQEQMSKQNQRFQESLAQSQLANEMKRKKRVNEFERIRDVKVNKEDDQSKESSEEQKEQDESESDLSLSVDHPYLGSKIDFSG